MSNKPKTTQKWMFIVGGTALTVLVAGLLFQVMKPETGKAGARGERAPRSTQNTGNTQTAGKRSVARVNGQLISYDQLAEECVARYGNKVLEGLINRTMIEQAFEGKPGAPTAQDVEKEIRTIAKKFNLDTQQWLQMMQSQQELTPDQYRRDVIWPMLALRKLAGREIAVTQKELDEAYERNYGERVRARVIVLDRIRQAQEVWEKAKQNPENFGRLAMEYSVDSSSKALEGKVPPIRRNAGSEEIEKAAFGLQPGEISGVIQIPENKHWVIIKCEGRTEPVAGVSMADVQAMLEEEIRDEKVRLLVEDTFKQLQANSRVDNYLTGVSTGSSKRSASGSRRSTGIQRVSGESPARSGN
mgnify:CR=1 FL=1